MTPLRAEITGVILAGGRGRRLGGADKGLTEYAGRPLIEYAIAALAPQVGALAISANRNRERYAVYGFPVVADATGDYAGPLAGMLAAMQAAHTEFVLTVPCDCPAPPRDLAGRLYAAVIERHADAGVAHDGARVQPVFALIRCSLAPDLHAFLDSGGRKTETWLARVHAVRVDFSDAAAAFANINTPDDLETG